MGVATLSFQSSSEEVSSSFAATVTANRGATWRTVLRLYYKNEYFYFIHLILTTTSYFTCNNSLQDAVGTNDIQLRSLPTFLCVALTYPRVPERSHT